MDMTGLPRTGEYRMATIQMPGSALILELIEYRGLDSAKAPLPSRVQDPGSFRLQLTFRDIEAALAGLKSAGSRVPSVHPAGNVTRTRIVRPSARFAITVL